MTRPAGAWPVTVLLELRPALDGHAGIPQETRLLFRGLRSLEGLSVEGLIQCSGMVLAKGLPAAQSAWRRPLTTDRQINRLSRIVVSMQKKLGSPYLAGIEMVVWHALGGKQQLFRFDAAHFRDFIWRSLFARTLPFEDYDSVTGADFRTVRVPWTVMHRAALLTRKLGHTVYARLDTGDFDVMVAETPYPAVVSPKTRLVVRYHDAIPLLMPHTISDKSYHQASHYHALRCNVMHGAYFACVSDATRSDLLSIFPEAEKRSATIHNMVSHHYFTEESSPIRVPEVITTRRSYAIPVHFQPPRTGRNGDEGSGEFEYLLIVSTIEPRKNHATLLAAWEQLRTERFPSLKLVVVGMLGWGNKAIVRKFLPWMERGELYVLEDVPAPELRLLYRHARATVCPSFGEGFDFSGVEAMRSGGAVVASEIAVHREVYADAAEFCSPYSIGEVARAIATVIDPANDARRQELVRKGVAVSQRYTPERLLPKWQEFLQTARTEGSRA